MFSESAQALLDESVILYRGEPVGTAAACDPDPVAENYQECFVRDFVPSALVFLMRGDYTIIKNFLNVVLSLCAQQSVMPGHQRATGLMPASFKVVEGEDGEQLVADFGERAIGRVAPVDSAMWWMILLGSYVRSSGDRAFAERPEVQESMRQTLNLYLKESFETAPTMLVPDASFMIDRRMGVYGHPLEIQSLLYGMLLTANDLLLNEEANATLLRVINTRLNALRSYVRIYYWMDQARLNEIHRYHSEQFGLEAVNVLNVYPESIPEWMDGWMPERSGFLVGNVGPGRIDFRFFAFGNLLAILFGLADEVEAQRIMKLYEMRWDELMGEVPAKLVYPAVNDAEWEFVTGSDPKNVAWSYHNGGNWPTLIWSFTAAALLTGRHDLAERAMAALEKRVPREDWPEYYDGRTGSLIGRRANLRQVWSATGYLVARNLLDDDECLRRFRQTFCYDARA